LLRLLYIAAVIICQLLLASCWNNATRDTPEQPADISLEPAWPPEPDPYAPDPEAEPDLPPAQEPGFWQTRNISPRLYGRDWIAVEDKLWYVDEQGIHCLNMEDGQQTAFGKANAYNSIFYVGGSLWFATNYLWGYYNEDFPEDQIPLARIDLLTEQYCEYPTGTFTGANATVLESLGEVIACADNQVFRYDKVNDQFIGMPEYGHDIWRIAGNEKIFATYAGTYPEYSLKLYQANGAATEYITADCLPDTFITEMLIAENELFICWGGEGEPAGVACLNTQTGTWVHFIDAMNQSDFSTPYNYTPISGYYGEIWARGEDSVYLPLTESLCKFSFQQIEFECVYSAEKNIHDALPFQNGIIINQYYELVFLDYANNSEVILENMKVSEIIKKSQDTVLAITDQGIFECRFIEY
jgi:hypothetical protein